MKYTNPNVESSYQENDLGRTLYDMVLKHRPNKIVEFGVLNGYSTIAMAMALDELGEGKIYAYDIFDKYPYKHSTMANTRANINSYRVSKYVELKEMNFEEWLKNPEQFDLLHVDISNKGDTIEMLYQAVKDQVAKGAVILFEGGSKERDEVEWMKKYNCKKINEIKVPFEIINNKYPSLSKII